MMQLESVGSFYVGGRQVRVSGRQVRTVSLSSTNTSEYDPNGDFLIESAYVQYFIPSKPKLQTPVLLVHGGGLTGSQWEDTPDGRPGWLQRLLESNFKIYVIDNVERGRAGFCSLEGEWPDSPIVRSEQDNIRLYRIDYPGQKFPRDAIHALSARTVPRWTSTAAVQREALRETVKKIGPVILLGFSQGGGLSFQVADIERDLVKACIALEPHGVPLDYAPGVPDIPTLMVFGDHVDDDPHWQVSAAKSRQGLEAWSRAGAITVSAH